MNPRCSFWISWLLLAILPAAHAAPVPVRDSAPFKPTLSARTAAPDQILADIRYTAELIARFAPSDKEAKEFLGAMDKALDSTLGPDWRKAVDTARPLFGYFNLESNLPVSTGAVLIPVKDRTAFESMVKHVVGKVDAGADGVLRFDFPGARSPSGKAINGYVRFANQYAYLTVNDPAVVALDRIPSPAQIVAGDPKAAVSARLYFDRLPEQHRQQAIGGVQQFKTLLNGNVGGDGAMKSMGVAWMQMVLLGGPMFQLYPLVEPAIRDGQELTLDFRYDRAHLNLNFEAALTAKTGSELSKLVAALKPVASLFPQMLGTDLAARGLMRGTIPADIRKVIVAQLEAGLAMAPQGDPVWGPFAAKIGESMLPTLREGEIDLAGGLRGPGKNDGYGIVAGLRLKDAAGVEKALREAVKALPKDFQAMFKLDATTVGEGKVHQILLPPLPEPAKSIVGESTVHIAFRPDRVVVAFGDGAPGILGAGLSAKPQPVAQSFVDASGRMLIPLVSKIDANAGKKFKAFIGSEIDRVPILEMAVEGGSTLKVRYGNGLATFVPLLGFYTFRAVGMEAQRIQVAPAAVPPAAPR
jgi:hypothetical protein